MAVSWIAVSGGMTISVIVIVVALLRAARQGYLDPGPCCAPKGERCYNHCKC